MVIKYSFAKIYPDYSMLMLNYPSIGYAPVWRVQLMRLVQVDCSAQFWVSRNTSSTIRPYICFDITSLITIRAKQVAEAF